jgi:hypothetical protein
MTWPTRQTWDRLGSAACLAFVLGTVITIDARARDRFWLAIDRSVDQGLAPVGEYVGVVSQAVVVAARDQSIAHAPLVLFSAIGVLLVLLMMRS